jgi:23S rRNA U2552 (ribose-2'-O)-methylase RlmE/FtsJ
MLEEFRSELQKSFGKVLLNKPSASRQESSELYIVCLNFKQ